MRLEEYLKNNRIIADGAMGTYYARKKGNDKLISEYANLEEPEFIEMIHKQYIDAGARLLRTNTFAANTDVLNIEESQLEKLIRAACQIAKCATGDAFAGNEKETDEPVFIAGDIGPIPFNPNRNKEAVIAEYKRICDIFIEEKMSAIIFETFSDLTMIEEVIAYVKAKSDMFIITDFCVNKNGYSSLGIKANRLLAQVEKNENIDAAGFNCGLGSGHMYQMLKKLILPNSKYLVCMPNAGYPEQLKNRMVFMDNAKYFSESMKKIAELGFYIMGGCCGTTPEYIQKIASYINSSPVLTIASLEREQSEEVAVREEKPNEFYKKIADGKKVVAVELDPPYDADYEVIMEYAQYLKQHNVDMITMADSPSGRSRVDSVLMSVKLAHDVGVPVMPHLCCRDKNMISMRSTILGAYINDIRNLLIVTGDPVPSVSRASISSVFDYNSIQLMNFVKEMNQEHFQREPIYYGGALNYKGQLDKVVERMKKKMDAGAKYFLTQPIYAPEDIERIHAIKEKIDAKILCGIMPFTSFRNANFVKNEFAGINVPDEIVARYHPDMSREEAEVTGAQIASEIIDELYTFADGYYFMLPFNRVSFMDKIIIK